VAGPAALGELTARASAPARVEVVQRLAPGDDAAVRALLRRSVIPGAVRVAFTREPSYALGDGVAGARDHLVVARTGGTIVGLGRGSVRTLYRNGERHAVAYLGELRLAEGVGRGVSLLREGYEALAGAMAGHGIQACFTSIASDNRRARTVLEHGPRLGLPAYTPLATLVTLVAPVPRGGPRRRGTGGAPAPGVAAPSMVALAGFLDRAARERHLTLPWDAARLHALSAHGVSPGDAVVATGDGGQVGAAALWDQRAFRQVIIDGYGGALRRTRPLVNVALWLAGSPRLPAPGTALAQASLLGATVATPDDWRILWPLVARAAARRGVEWVTLARDARDPELAVLRPLLRGREYHTTLYDVALRGTPTGTPWDARLVRPEVGLL